MVFIDQVRTLATRFRHITALTKTEKGKKYLRSVETTKYALVIPFLLAALLFVSAPPAAVQAQDEGGICDRSAPVRDAIMAELADSSYHSRVIQSDCSNVTAYHLSLNWLNFLNIDGSDYPGVAIAEGDFDGLTATIHLTVENLDTTTALPSVSAMTNLGTLTVTGNPQLTSLSDLSQNTGLESLRAGNNGLTSLPDLSKNTRLRWLEVGDNSLTSLPDLSQNTALEYLRAQDNDLTSLPDLSKNTRLRDLWVYDNRLTSLPDLSNNTALIYLKAQDNNLTSLPNLSAHTALRQLIVGGNVLTSLPDFSALTALETLNVNDNNLTSLPDLSENTALAVTWARNNRLTALPDLSNNTKLIYLSVRGNRLTALPDLSNNTKLHSLWVYDNRLTALPDLSQNTALTTLHAYDNRIYPLPDLSANTNLRDKRLEPQSPATFGIAPAGPANEGASAQLTLTLSENASSSLEFSVDVTYGSGAGVASAADLGDIPATVEVPPGGNSGTFQIPIATDDADDEGDETFTVSVSTDTPGWKPQTALVSAQREPATTTVTIRDVAVSKFSTSEQGEATKATLSFGSAAISDKVYTVGGRVYDLGLPLAQVEGGYVQVDYTATGLPAGLELTSDRAIRGTPTEPTNTPATVTYTAAGSGGSTSTASLTFQVTVMPPVELSETNIATVVYTIGQARPLNVVLPEASGGEAPLTYHLLRNRIAKRVSPMEIRNGEVKSLSDSNIFGVGAVAFDISTRTLSGAPQRANRSALTYYAIDANGAFAQTAFDMRVANPPRFKTIADKTYAIGETVNEKLPKPVGGAIYNYYSRTQYELTPLPKGLSFGVSNRRITGTVTAETPARTTVTYTVTDLNGVSATTTFDIIVPGGASTPTVAPTLTAYSDEGNTIIALNWEDVDGATGYVVQVKAPANEWPATSEESLPPGAYIHHRAPIDIGGGRTARAFVFRLTRGAEYSIRVAAVNEDGTGPFSEAVTVTPPPLPAAPQITASAWGNTLNLDWENVKGATGYIVQVKASDAAWPTVAKQSLPADTWTLKNHKLGRLLVVGLTMGGSYQVRMAAVNKSGAGEFSTVWNFVLGVRGSATPVE